MINWDNVNNIILGLSRKELLLIRDYVDFRIVKNHQEVSDIVIQTCCQHYNVSLIDFYSKSRLRSIVQSKHMAFYIMRTFNMNTIEIGRLTGNMNHATVIHGSKKIENQISLYKETENDFSALIKEINNKMVRLQKRIKLTNK